MPLQVHEIAPPVAPPRRSSMSSSDRTTHITKVINRTRKPPTISTTPSLSHSSVGPCPGTGPTSPRDTPTTPTPRPTGGSRRKAVPTIPLPALPTQPMSLTQVPEATAKTNAIATATSNRQLDAVKRDSSSGTSSGSRTNSDHDVNSISDRTHQSHTNASQGSKRFHHTAVTQQQQHQDTQAPKPRISSMGKKDATKQSISLDSPADSKKAAKSSTSHHEVSSSNTSPSLLAQYKANPSTSTLGTESTSSADSSRSSGSTHADPNHHHHHLQQQSSKGSIVGQKLGDFLGIGGSLLRSKKRGSDTSTKTGWTSPSASTGSMTSRDGGSGSSFGNKNFDATTSPTTPKSSLVSKMFGGQNQQSHQSHHYHHQHSHSHSGALGIDSSLRNYDPAFRGSAPWTSSHGTNESRIINWEMNKTVTSSEYENESFALWIRPNIQARTVISGADVENAERASALNTNNSDDQKGTSNIDKDVAATTWEDERRMKYRPELEDMKVLEEVLDFSIVILMRASASLYPFIASAHSKSISINIPWKTLQYEDRGWKYYNVRTLKEYQDYVMADIGCAIQAMIEIYDQQERPYSHPDNMGRDTKPPQRGSPVVLPPHKPRLNKKAMSNNSVNSHNGSGRIPPSRPSSTSITPSVASSATSPPKKHRRHSSIPGGRPTISSMITSIKQSLPSPMSLHSPLQGRGSTDGYSHPFYSSYPDGTPFSSGLPARSVPLSYTQAESIDHSYSFSQTTTSASGISTAGGGRGGGFLPHSIQTMINSLRNNSINSTTTSPSPYISNANTVNSSNSNSFVNSPGTPPVTLSKQEEKRQQMERRWRVDIMRRKAHLRAWACRCFLDLYHYSLTTAGAASLEDEFKDLYRIMNAIVEVDANASERAHDVLASVISQARELEKEPFKLKYSQYKTKAPTEKEIIEANEDAVKRFAAEYASQADTRVKHTPTPVSSLIEKDDQASLELAFDECVAPLRQLTARGSLDLQDALDEFSLSPSSFLFSSTAAAYDCMEFYGLQGHSVWEPLLDRLTKFDTTHHELDARNIFQFLRRMSLYSPAVTEGSCHVLSSESRNEMLSVLWVLEKCVQERPDFQQSPTWFRLSSSASAVQAVVNAGGVIPYLKELREKDTKGRDPILTLHPVTLTGYFKRLLKESGGLLLKETTGLFVELARPATDNGDFWNLEKLSRIDRALLYRVICLDLNRGHVFLRISRVMEKILESSPKDMELDAFALSKMVQVVELSGVLDLKALRRWNGAWSAIILGYM